MNKEQFLEAFEELGACSDRYIYRWTCDYGTTEEMEIGFNEVKTILDELVEEGKIFVVRCGSKRIYGLPKELGDLTWRI